MMNKKISKLIEGVIPFFSKPEVLTLAEYAVANGMTMSKLNDLCAEHPELKEAMEFAKEILAVRINRGIATKQYSSEMLKYLLPTYSLEYKQAMEYQVRLKESLEQEDKPTNIVLVDHALKHY